MRRRYRPCTKCGDTYVAGHYGDHIRTSEGHREAVTRRIAAVRKGNSTRREAGAARRKAIVAEVIGPPRRSLEEVAAKYGVSRQAISQLVHREGYDLRDRPLDRVPVHRWRECPVCGMGYRNGIRRHSRALGHSEKASRGSRHKPERDAALAARWRELGGGGGLRQAGARERTRTLMAEFGLSEPSVYLALYRQGIWQRGQNPKTHLLYGQAWDLYSRTDMTQKEVANALGVNLSTVVRAIRLRRAYDAAHKEK